MIGKRNTSYCRKVDGLISPEEFQDFFELGADVVTLSLADKTIATSDIEKICQTHATGTICADLTGIRLEAAPRPSELYEWGIRLVQFGKRCTPPSYYLRELKAEGIEVVLSDLEVDYDEVDEWMFLGASNDLLGAASYTQLDLYPTLDGVLDSLRTFSTRNCDSFGLNEVVEYAQQSKAFFNLDWTKSCPDEFHNLVPEMFGMTLVVRDSPDQRTRHHVTKIEAIDLATRYWRS